MAQLLSDYENNLPALCDYIRRLARTGEYARCENLIASAMGRHPHAPEPHNLMGVVLEIQNDHAAAMKHFRAAWSLDPGYVPARHNLTNCASLYARDVYAYDESDCHSRDDVRQIRDKSQIFRDGRQNGRNETQGLREEGRQIRDENQTISGGAQNFRGGGQDCHIEYDLRGIGRIVKGGLK